LQLSGEVEFPPDRRAIASGRLAGTVHRIHVDRDQTVRAGDVLAEVASLELQTLQLELLRSHLKLGLLEQTLNRLRPLAEQEGSLALNRRQWREAQGAHGAALLRRDSLRLKLEAVGLSAQQIDELLTKRQFVDAIPVRAPIAGSVVQLRAALGQAVKAEDPLVEIHDPAGAVVRGFVSERQLGGVRVGQAARVRLTAEPGWTGTGVVTHSSQEFQSADRTLSVWVRLEETPGRPLRHGLLAGLTLIAEISEPTLAVPRDAVLREGTAEFLFVRGHDGVFERRRVQTGRSDDLRVEITSGLQSGEQVAVRGVQELQTGYAALR
jgi:cobalt-zinc-cadmium efflux system membrane fusion protein